MSFATSTDSRMPLPALLLGAGGLLPFFALATGITGAALLAGGAVALTLGLRPRRTHPYSIRPHFAAKLVGLTLSGRF